jgi:hypothetical protein
MRSVRRLPPLLRALWVLGLLTSLAALGVLTWTNLAARGADQSGASRGWNRGMALFMALLLLSMAGSVTLAAYNRRFERPRAGRSGRMRGRHSSRRRWRSLRCHSVCWSSRC